MDFRARRYARQASSAAAHGLYSLILDPAGDIVFAPDRFPVLASLVRPFRSPTPGERIVLQTTTDDVASVTLSVEDGVTFHVWAVAVEQWEGALILGAAPAPNYRAVENDVAQALGACATMKIGALAETVLDCARHALDELMADVQRMSNEGVSHANRFGLSTTHPVLARLGRLHRASPPACAPGWDGLVDAAALLLDIAAGVEALDAALVAHVIAEPARTMDRVWPEPQGHAIRLKIGWVARMIDAACDAVFAGALRIDDRTVMDALRSLRDGVDGAGGTLDAPER